MKKSNKWMIWGILLVWCGFTQTVIAEEKSLKKVVKKSSHAVKKTAPKNKKLVTPVKKSSPGVKVEKKDLKKSGTPIKKATAPLKKASFQQPPKTPSAKHPKLLGTYGDWRAYETEEGGKKVCYMTSFPKKESGSGNNRGSVYMLIAHRPSLKSYDVVSFDAGYAYKKGTQIEVQVDGEKPTKFKLFTEKETAWCADPSTDKKLAETILKGTKIVVAGESEKGTKTQDIYSLNGSTAAYTTICKACGVKR